MQRLLSLARKSLRERLQSWDVVDTIWFRIMESQQDRQYSTIICTLFQDTMETIQELLQTGTMQSFLRKR